MVQPQDHLCWHQSWPAALATAGPPRPGIAQSERARTLRFVPYADLTVLDPVWTTADIVRDRCRSRFTPYYLHTDGGLRPDAPPAGAAPLSWTSDPANPVPTVGGAITSMEPLVSGGGYDQRERPGMFGHKPPYLPLASRPDVLAFQTEPLPADMEVAGPVAAHLWIASDAPGTDITVKLVDVHPPSADYPHYDLDPQTGEAEGAWRRTQAAVNTLFLDADRPSHVVLPLPGEAG